MILCQELRIGNYALVNGSIQRVAMVSVEGFDAPTPSIRVSGDPSGHLESCTSEIVQPVLLTDLILQQCGFVFHEYFKFWQLIHSSAEQRSELDIDPDYNVIDFMRRPIVKKLTSLHQLQNLYFALKGKELVFQPNLHLQQTTPVHSWR
jgi:hypothetical protein